MRVVHYSDSFSLLTETFVYAFVTELERQGLDNYVLCRMRKNESTRPFDKVQVVAPPNRYHPLRIAHRVVAEFTRVRKTEYLWPMRRRALEARVARIRPQVMHVHFGPEAVLIAPAARKLGIPLIASFYGYDISRLPHDPVWRGHYEGLWEQLAAVAVLSKDMKREVVRLGCPADRARIIHVSTNLSPSRLEERSEIRRLVSVGRLAEKKGHDDAIRALHVVVQRYPHVHLDIVGEGPQRPQLEALIAELGLDAHVSLIGALPLSGALQALGDADAFVLCSKTAPDGDKEGTPTVLVEAQLKGLPCVTTMHAGIPEMVPEENHWLLGPEGDARDAAARIIRLIEASADQLSAVRHGGLRFVEEHFNLARETGKLRALYQEVIPSSPPSV